MYVLKLHPLSGPLVPFSSPGAQVRFRADARVCGVHSLMGGPGWVDARLHRLPHRPAGCAKMVRWLPACSGHCRECSSSGAGGWHAGALVGLKSLAACSRSQAGPCRDPAWRVEPPHFVRAGSVFMEPEMDATHSMSRFHFALNSPNPRGRNHLQ